MADSNTLYQIEYYRPWFFFIVFQTICLIVFGFGILNKWHASRTAKSKSLYRKVSFQPVFRIFWREVISQLQIKSHSKLRWLMHLFIFYGFVGLALISLLIEILKLAAIEAAFSQHLVDFWGDLFGLVLLVGVVAATFRRLVHRNQQILTTGSDGLALGLLLAIALSGFALEVLRLGLIPPDSGKGWFSFVGFPLAQISGFQAPAIWLSVLWTLHGILGGLFVAYIPYSNFTHIFAAPAEILINASEEGWRGDLYGYSRQPGNF